jgi:hypothetical protein
MPFLNVVRSDTVFATQATGLAEDEIISQDFKWSRLQYIGQTIVRSQPNLRNLTDLERHTFFSKSILDRTMTLQVTGLALYVHVHAFHLFQMMQVHPRSA